MKPRRPELMVIEFLVLIFAFMITGYSAEINAQPESATKSKPAAVSPPIRVIDSNEGSGNPVDWSDDEDIVADGSGSGDGEPPVQPVPSIAHRDLITPPSSPPPALPKPTVTERPVVQVQHPTKSPTVAPPPPASKSAQRDLPLPLLILILTTLCILGLRF